jgi:1,2-dihydroxy-3-keto-5-methylthiopentene dioxygenase
MSRLTLFKDDAPGTPLLSTDDPARIAAELAPIGVRFERWEVAAPPPFDADNETVLATYRPHLDRLMAGAGYGTADVLRLTPETPNLPAIRAKFLSEHTHTEDEVRFFVHGAGNFVLHVNGHVYDAHCTAGDLISVPTGTKHWFDAGTSPRCMVLRVFTDVSGWNAHYTGNAIAEAFPVVTQGSAPAKAA